MVQIELTEEMAEVWREVLVSYLSGLRIEMAYTQRKEFREFLKKRGELLEQSLLGLEKELAAGGREMVSMDKLRTVDIFQGLTDWELKIVSQFFQEEKMAEGVTLFQEGEKADRLFILEEGAVSIRLEEGEKYEIYMAGKIVGWSFLVPPNRYTASAVTIAPSKLLVIKSPDFYYLIHKEPKMGVKVMENLARVVAGRLSQLRGRV
jgi:CRP/FNR family cyclic AMP-dependent transcriptional regulator